MIFKTDLLQIMSMVISTATRDEEAAQSLELNPQLTGAQTQCLFPPFRADARSCKLYFKTSLKFSKNNV